MPKLRHFIITTLAAAYFAVITAPTALGFGSNPTREMQDFQYPAAVQIVKDHLERVRPKFAGEKTVPGRPLFTNAFIMVASIIKTWETELHLCQFPGDDDRTDCFQDNLERFAKRARKDGSIDSISAFEFKLFAEAVEFKNGKLSFNAEVLSETAKDYPTVPNFSTYLTTRNTLKRVREEITQTANLEDKVLKAIRETYRREVQDIGDVTLDEYVLATYSEMQVKTLGKLMAEMSKMKSGFDVRMVISQSDSEEFERLKRTKQAEIEATQKEIDIVIAAFSKVNGSDSSSASNRSEFEANSSSANPGNDIVALTQKLVSLNRSLREIEEKYESGLTKIDVEATDICRFTDNFIRLKIREELENQDGALRGSAPPAFPDILIAGYLTGVIEGEELLRTLEMPEMKEHYPTFWEKAKNISLGVARFASPLIPVYGYYVGLAFMVYDTLDKKGDYEQKTAQEAQLIR